MGREHFLEHLTWPEVDGAAAQGVDAVLLPIGSTEQHGRHMPLDTDCFIARSLSERVAEAAGERGLRVLVAPTLNVTLSWYHSSSRARSGSRRTRSCRCSRRCASRSPGMGSSTWWR